jgi:hypothetical protein
LVKNLISNNIFNDEWNERIKTLILKVSKISAKIQPDDEDRNIILFRNLLTLSKLD